MNNVRSVLITLPDLNGPGGVSHYYRAVLPHLPKSVEHLVTGTNYSKGTNYPSPVRLLKDVVAFIRRMREYDLIHLNPSLCARCFFREMLMLAAAKLAHRRVLVFFRGWEKSFENAVDTKWRWLFRAIYCRADAMVVLAAEFESALRRWGYQGRIYVETTTVDETMLNGYDPQARALTGEGFRVLFLARLEKSKGIYDAADAVIRLSDHRVKLIIGGDGSEKKELEEYIAHSECKNIKLPGYLRGEAKIAAYRDADVFLFPSYYGEGMPNSVLEAMAFGLPIVTCPTGGIRDFFEDGVMGFLVPPRDADAIVSALRRLWESPALWAKISTFNANYSKKKFHSMQVARRLMRIYEDTMS